MANIRTWLESFERKSGEVIEAIVVGQHYSRPNGLAPFSDENVILSREDGLSKVDQEFDNGYGGADCFPVYAWLPSWVCYVHEYDGSTELRCLPRHPVNCEPQFSSLDEQI